jgi:hypothetical protein
MSRPITAALIVLVALIARTVGAQQCTPFFDQQEFEIYCQDHAKILKGIETFEESNIPPTGKQPLPAPLDQNPNVVDGIGFPEGLEQQNIIIQDNLFPGPSPPFLDPSGLPVALFVIGPGFLDSNSKKVGEDLFLDGIWASLDLIFTEPNHTGIGFQLSRFMGYQLAPWIVTVYNKSDEIISVLTVPPPPTYEPTKSFFGLWCDETIGRINIYDLAGPEPDAIDDIQMWMDIPQEEQLYQLSWQEAVHFEFVLMPPLGHPPIDKLQMFDPRWIDPAGLVDPSIIFKSASICNTDTICTQAPTTWEKINCDPASPRFRREAWWFFPPVPEGAVSPDMDIVFSLSDPPTVPLAGSYEVDYMTWFLCQPVKGGTFRFVIPEDGVGIPDFEEVFEDGRILKQNRPNPFRPSTTISYHLDRATQVKLSIYNVQGALVRVLTDDFQEAGPHHVQWDGRDNAGNRVASGAYFYEIQAGIVREARKMVRLR